MGISKGFKKLIIRRQVGFPGKEGGGVDEQQVRALRPEPFGRVASRFCCQEIARGPMVYVYVRAAGMFAGSVVLPCPSTSSYRVIALAAIVGTLDTSKSIPGSQSPHVS